MQLTTVDWAVLAAGVLLVGFAKTAVTSAGALAVVLFALVLPARESTGALLPLLCGGDLIALSLYRRHANWNLLLRMLIGVVPGLLMGAFFVKYADDTVMRRTIGVVLLVMVLGYVLTRRGRARGGSGISSVATVVQPRLVTASMGVIAGFTTMTANAGGPVASLYLLSARVPKMEFLGTAAWFFFSVNAAKLPLSAGIGLMTSQSLLVDAVLAPFLLFGAMLGTRLIKAVNQDVFEQVATALTAVAALILVL